MASDERRSAKQSVLYEVNQVLVKAGLNDTVWSIRDCDSTLFVLIFKKLVGKLPGIVTSPNNPEEHAKNFDVVLKALTEDERVGEEVPPLDTSGLSAQALAEGDLQALNKLAGVFGVLCNALLQESAADVRPAGSSSAMPTSARAARPASAVPVSYTQLTLPTTYLPCRSRWSPYH